METLLIKQMRQDGKTLQEIANHFGKSLTWVYTRINEKYAVKRKNNTVAEDTTEIEEPANEFEEMRKAGCSFNTIAKITGTSVTTAYKKVRRAGFIDSKERLFRDNDVIPYIKNILNHVNVVKEFTIAFQRADVMSITPDGQVCITEVKNTISGHAIQTSIGQLIMYQLSYPDAKLQLALPDTVKVPDHIVQHLKKYNIFTIFVEKKEQ